MKKKKVKDCESCPYKDRGVWGSMDFCEKERKHIKDINILPKWCSEKKN